MQENNDVMEMLRITAFNSKQLSEQMGLVVSKISDMDTRVAGIEDRMQKYEDRVRVSRSQSQAIRTAIHKRVDEILHIEHEGGTVKDVSIGKDLRYKGGFISRCYKDARDKSRLGTPYYETLTRDFDEVMEYIEGWRPNVEGGVDGYKRYLDIRREEREKMQLIIEQGRLIKEKMLKTYEVFKRLLNENDKTVYQVSKATGITTPTFTHWKKGMYQPKIEKLQLIADYFNVPVNVFLNDDGNGVICESKKFSHIEIRSVGDKGSAVSEIFIDGHKLNGVRSFEFSNTAGNHIPVLKLELNALDISVDSACVIYDKNLMQRMEIVFLDDEKNRECF